MTRQLSVIFNEEFQRTQKVIDEEQYPFMFNATCEAFFSRISPIKEITDELRIIDTIPDDDDSTLALTEPLNYYAYELPLEYISVFRELSNYFFNESEKDNFQLMEQFGAEVTVDVIDGSLEEIFSRINNTYVIELPIIIM